MADIVNLNRFRKAKTRAAKDERAQQNRIEHGTPKALKALTAAQKALEDKKLTGKKLCDEPDKPDDRPPDSPNAAGAPINPEDEPA